MTALDPFFSDFEELSLSPQDARASDIDAAIRIAADLAMMGFFIII